MTDSQYSVTTTAGDELPVSQAVVESVADATSRDVADLAPLVRTVDPDALDGLLAPRPGNKSGPLGLTFEYSGCRVTVERREDGGVTVSVRNEPG